MQINVDISELKRNSLQRMNEIPEVPADAMIPQKVDNDLESSDVGFSDGHDNVVVGDDNDAARGDDSGGDGDADAANQWAVHAEVVSVRVY